MYHLSQMSVSFKSDEYSIFRNRLCNKTSLTMSSCVNKNDYMQPEMKNMGCICGDIWSNINTQKGYTVIPALRTIVIETKRS